MAANENFINNLSPNFLISPDKTYATLNVPIEKSENDDREYRLIKLANELEILLIHDPNTDKSSAAMDVHIGQIHDPPNLQGLGHFCEHLLFMGSEKYPKDNDYTEYLTKHNGTSNAYTSIDDTNYYFEVSHEYLEGSLDRFAQFFICPLFSLDCTEKELNAVDSEYKNYRQEDVWRKYQLEKSLCNKNHPFSQFGIGNIESLKEIPLKAGLDVREELIKHHKKYYSANLMKLVVLGREPLDQLNNWVVEQFSGVKNKSIPVPIPDGYPITEKELGNLISVKPVKNTHNLEITFPFPDQNPLYETKPAGYISHLIGHEGEGSILSLLKKKGWANKLGSSSIHQSINFEVFKISIDLTEEGLVNYEDIVKICFQYINMLKQIDPKEQERIFNEVKTIASIDFRFLEKCWPSNYTSELSTYMQRPYPREHILSTPYLFRKYDAKLITEGLNFLNWNTCVLTLSSKLLSGFNKKEKWFDTEYKFEPINPKFLQELQDLTLNPELKVYRPNEFIPSNFEVKKIENVTPLERPFLIKDTKLTRLWYKKDDKFWVPKVEAHFLLNTPLAHATPLYSVMTRLYIDLVVDALSDFSHDAEIAGLIYYLYDQNNGIAVSVTGYNDKATLFLDKIIQRMKNFIINPERFLKIKEELKRTLQNRLLDSPYEIALYHINYIIHQKMWNFQEKLDVLDEINYQDVQEFYPKLFKQMFFEGVVHGNMNKSEAVNMIEIIENILGSKELSSSQLIDSRSLLLKEGKYVYFKEVKDEKEINSAIDYYIQIGDIMDKNLRAKLALIGQIVEEPCFFQLRTQEQLGYLVWSITDKVTGSMGFRIILQSEKDTIYLENRIEEFFNKLQKIIEDMSDEEYDKQKTSVINKRLEKFKNMGEESNRYWYHICSGYYEFNEVKIDVENLRQITKPEILSFFNTYIHPKSSQQKKISIHMKSQNTELIKKFNSIDIKKLHELIISSLNTSNTSNAPNASNTSNTLNMMITIDELQNAINLLKIQGIGGVQQTEIEMMVKKFFLNKINSNINGGDSDTSDCDKKEVMDERILKVIDGLVSKVVNIIFAKEKINGNDNDNSDVMIKDEEGYKLSEDNEIIEDLILFKSKMQLSSSSYPVLPLSDFYEK
ncbi:hypothetical protein Glove_134g40 [Diversispora epigaea]|uniref:Uncharacterized protein n=1 Tax=Diversispora epigaea TaxID=1348612 RepID=A0A397J799_9GLOM|nr:hypothetical protein Glove_134g40 [Diversispora epigaea]